MVASPGEGAAGRPAVRAGLSLVELLVVIAILGVLVALLLPAVQMVRNAAARADCQNRLRQIDLAAHQYHDAHRQLPPGCSTSVKDFQYMSWLARLLPYMEQQAVYDQAVRDYARQPQFSFPLDGHTDLALPMKAYTCPLADRLIGHASYLNLRDEPFTVGLTWYQGVSGTNSLAGNGLLYANSAVPFGGITDGLSNTLLVGERPPSPDDRFGWWYCGVGQPQVGNSADYFLGVRDGRDRIRLPMCDDGPQAFRPGKLDDLCDVLHFWSRHPGGANFAFADGSVRFLSYSADPILPALATRAGNETAPPLD